MTSLPLINPDAAPDSDWGTGTKTAYSDQAYQGASLRVMEGYGSKGAKPRPFNTHAAVRHFSSWIYKATMVNANAVARIPLRLYTRRPGGTGGPNRKLFKTAPVGGRRLQYFKGMMSSRGRSFVPSDAVRRKVAEWDGEFDEVTEAHPALRVLTSVNPWMGGFRLTQLRMIYLLLAGNAYTFKVTDPVLDVPSELWPMPPQWTRIKPSRENFIDGYVYGAGQENERIFLPDEVIHNKLPNPRDLHYGLGKVEAAWAALGIDVSKHVMDQAKFDNMNRPDWMIIFENKVSPEALTRLEAGINAKYGGPANSGKVMAFGGGKAAIQALNEQLEDYGSPDRIVEEIAAVFETPVSMLKANDPTKGGATTADVGWLRDTVRPLALGDEEELNEQYLSSFDVGDDAFLAYDPVSFEDETVIRRNASAGLSGGLLTVNEGREEIGYAPVAGGDIRFFPSGATGPNASLLGGSAPGQMDERTNENGVTPGNSLPEDQSGEQSNDSSRDATRRASSPASSSPSTPKNSEGTVGLNGAQITAAVDVFNKLRAGTLWTEAATESLVAVGIARENVDRAINAMPQDDPNVKKSEKDQEFLRSVWLAFLNDGTINDVLANMTALTRLRDGVGVPGDPNYIDPFLPVQDAQGRAVTGELVKDSEGDVIGAAVNEPAQPELPSAVDLAKD